MPKLSTAPKIMPVDLHDPSLVLYLPLWYPAEDMCRNPIYSYNYSKRHIGVLTGTTWGTTGRTFDGIDDKISVADDASIQLTQFTLIAWFNYSSLDAAETSGMCGKMAYGANFKGYQLYVRANGTLVIGVGDNAILKEDEILASTTANNWYMAGGTYDEAALTAYLNGVSSGSPTATAITIADSGGAFTVGEQLNDADRFWHGLIGEVILYNKALTEANIKDIYDATKWRYK